jgi:hypothetical protein
MEMFLILSICGYDTIIIQDWGPVGNTSLDYSVNFWTEGVFSTALGVFGVAGIGIVEDDAIIASEPLFKKLFLFIGPFCVRC